MKALNYFILILSLSFIAIVSFETLGRIDLLRHNLPTAVLICGLSIPLTLLFLNYVQLRNIKIYIMWLVVGVIMLVVYINFKDSAMLELKRGSAMKSFKSTFAFLVMFQVCRFLCVKTTGQEYITPSNGTTDLFENRKPGVQDFIIFLVLFATIIGAQEL